MLILKSFGETARSDLCRRTFAIKPDVDEILESQESLRGKDKSNILSTMHTSDFVTRDKSTSTSANDNSKDESAKTVQGEVPQRKDGHSKKFRLPSFFRFGNKKYALSKRGATSQLCDGDDTLNDVASASNNTNLKDYSMTNKSSSNLIKVHNSSTAAFNKQNLTINVTDSSSDYSASATAQINDDTRSLQKKVKPSIQRNTPLIFNANPNSVVTMAELEKILLSNEFVRRKELDASLKSYGTGRKKVSTDGEVAFPQPSALTDSSIILGTSISSAAVCLFLGTTVHPNLWLVGAVFGVNIGHRIAREHLKNPSEKLNFFPQILMNIGKRLARYYLGVYDFCKSMWFLYKTGELSYNYMKQYQTLDDQYQIQQKIDAWNARFKQGKVNFDRWEKDNEVGRKMLAGLRTIWLVEEKSLRAVSSKRSSSARYRIVEYGITMINWVKKIVYALWDALNGGGLEQLRDILDGIKMSIQELNWENATRMAASGIMAFFSINILCTLFQVSPLLISFVAFLAGAVWPEWVSESLGSLRGALSGNVGKRKVLKEKEKVKISERKSFGEKSLNTKDIIEDVCSEFNKILERLFPKDKDGTNISKKQMLNYNLTLSNFRASLRWPRRKKEVKKVWGGTYRNISKKKK